ncbi:MAG: 6,7-dimethyl-8-ribityllumazine synthase [Gaiellaceae bacterium]
MSETLPDRDVEELDEPHELRPEREQSDEQDDEPQQHAYGDLDIPDDVNVLEGMPDGTRRSVAIVASRFNGEITNQLLETALEELDEAGVRRDAVTVMPVPGAFELPLAAMALAKTRRYACVVALVDLGAVPGPALAHDDSPSSGPYFRSWWWRRWPSLSRFVAR